MTEDNTNDTLPVGMCIDFTPQNPIVISEYTTVTELVNTTVSNGLFRQSLNVTGTGPGPEQMVPVVTF